MPWGIGWVCYYHRLFCLFETWFTFIYHILYVFVDSWTINCFSRSPFTFLHAHMSLVNTLNHVLTHGLWDDNLHCSVSDINLDAYATGCHLTLCICSSTAPKPSFEALVEIFVGFDGSKNVRTGSVVTVSLNFFHSFSCRAVYSNTVFSLRHAVLEVRLGINLPRKLIIRIALRTLFFGSGGRHVQYGLHF